MKAVAQPQTQYVDALKIILELILKETPIKISTIIDFRDPVCVFRPDEDFRKYRQAVGYFRLTIESRMKRRFLWDQVDVKDIATMAVYRNGTLDVFVDDANFNSQAGSIAHSFEESTGRQTKLYPKN